MEEENARNITYYRSYNHSSWDQLQSVKRMQGARRVITFCIIITVLPVILLLTPLYLRHNRYADVTYSVAESDILEMVNGISSIFCQEHSLKMNTPFNAFQVQGKPKMASSKRKHIRLKKSMSLPDDTLEYWGFFLPTNSTVTVSVCSRYDGSRILVVKGEKNLRNCGLMQPTQPVGHMAEGQGTVYVKYNQAAVETEVEESSYNVGKEIIDDDPDPNQIRESLLNGNDLADSKTREEKSGNSTFIETKNDLVERKRQLETVLQEGDEQELPVKNRTKRYSPTIRLDGGIAHGGNAVNYSDPGNDSSISSFESSLLTCYSGQILLSQGFDPHVNCTGTHYLETGRHLSTVHDVVTDGYYYYIFYSDNDYVQNDIYTIFDIYKPTYQYGNYSYGCINKTECVFPIKFWSDEVVVVEVPTRDGIEHETDDISILISRCHPRTAVYAIFPVAMLLIILLCAFV